MKPLSFKEFLIEGSEYEALKKNKKPLSTEEREEVMGAKAIWHHGTKGEASPAVWKSVNKNGKSSYVTNTHRAWQKADTVKGAIKAFHDFIKGTAR